MENTKNNQEVQKPQTEKESTEKVVPLYEDMSGHKNDDASYNKLMNEQKNNMKKDK